jgi:hypothetical protein
VTWAIEQKGYSQRRACGLIGLAPKTYAIGRAIDARLTIAALRTAIEGRKPPPGCIHHSDSECMQAGSAWRSDLRLK